MPTFEDHAAQEYRELMSQGRSVERTGQICWTAGAVSGAMMLSWAVASRSPALMIPVVLAFATGFYASHRARQQARWIESYVEEFHERVNGAQWFTRVRRLENTSGHRPVSDWLTTIVANAGVVVSVLLSWMYASSSSRGDLMAALATAFGALFAFHSIYETVRMDQTRRNAAWHQVSGELKEADRPRQVGSY